MLSDDKIMQLYSEFIKEVDDSITFPRLLIKHSKEEWCDSRIDYTNKLDVTLILGDVFDSHMVSEKFLISNLYHEFTHIWDECKWLNMITDFELKKRQLFPYTEFHASHIEIQKRMELSTNVGCLNWRTKDITPNYFTQIMFRKICNTFNIIQDRSDLNAFQIYLFILSYNIGYYSILRKYSFALSDLINLDDIEIVSEKVVELSEMLCNETASDKLCFDSHNLMIEIICKLADNLSLKPEEWYMFLP